MTLPNHVVIRASDLAAVSGKHPYRPYNEEVKRIKAQIFDGMDAERKVKAEIAMANELPSDTVDAAESVGVDTKPLRKASDEVKQIQQASLDVTKTVCEAKEKVRKATTVKELSDAKATLVKNETEERRVKTELELKITQERKIAVDVNDELNEKIRTLSLKEAKSGIKSDKLKSLPVQQVVQQHQRMAEGIVQEHDILTMAKQKIGEPWITQAEKPMGFNKKILLCETSDKIPIYLVGACDGLSPDTVIEIKNRKYKLFHQIKLYERIQLEAYMRLYGKKTGVLIENFEGCLHHIPINKSDELWEDVTESVKKNIEHILASS